MTVNANLLNVKVVVMTPEVRNAEDLEVHVTYTNVSSTRVQLNTLFFDFASLMLRVRRAKDASPINPGPPPLPPIDDGKTGRVVLDPGKSATFIYKGADYFTDSLEPGTYEIRYRYENTVADHGDWTGVAESAWIGFEVLRKHY